MTRIRYKQIADELRPRLLEAPGGTVLPSEADLSTEFGASRVTIRRALEVLRADRLVDSRQGFGWFVAGRPVRQRLESLTPVEGQVEGAGRHAERRIEDFAFESSPEFVREALGVSETLKVRRTSLADGQPFAVVTVWVDAELGHRISRQDVEQSPFHRILRAEFGIELRGATQSFAADLVEPADAVLLGIPPGSPILRCRRITSRAEGDATLVSEHLFPAYRTEFVVDYPNAEPSTTPSGLRLVE